MLKALGSFFIKAAPRAVKELMKPGKGVTKYFKNVSKSWEKSKAYKFTEDFLGKKPGEFVKDQAKAAINNGAAFDMVIGFAKGVAGNLASKGTTHSAGIYGGGTPRTSAGTPVPGASTMNIGMMETTKSFNRVSQGMSKLDNDARMASLRSKKLVDSYKKDISKKDFSIGELTGIGAELGKSARFNRATLTSNLDGKKPKMLKNIPMKGKLKNAPPSQDTTAREINSYLNTIINQLSEKQESDSRIINENLDILLRELSTKEDTTANQMMTNLGRYNEATLEKLGELIAKAETASFKKQQESSFHQTSLLSEKIDSSHDFTVKGIETLRSEILSNTQTMYAINKQNRAIDEEYRAAEDRKNKGVTLSNIYTFVQQIAKMVQMQFKTPEVWDQNMKDAMYVLAEQVGYELGQFAQTLFELSKSVEIVLAKFHKKVKDIPLVGDIVFGMGKGLMTLNKNVFEGLLGLNGTGVGLKFDGESGYFENYEDLENNENESLGTESTFRNSLGVGVLNTKLTGIREVSTYKSYEEDKLDGLKTKGKGKFQSITGKLSYLQGDDIKQWENETDEDYYSRISKIAISQEAENLKFKKDNQIYVDNAKIKDTKDEAVRRWKTEVSLISDAYMKYSNNANILEKGTRTGRALKRDADRLEYSKTTVGDEYALAKDKIINSSLFKGKSNFTVKIYKELGFRLAQCFKIASNLGIRYTVNDTIRPVTYKVKYRSNHQIGLAVDVGVEGVAGILEKFGFAGSPYIKWSQLEHMVMYKELNGKELSSAQYEIIKSWWDLLNIFNSVGDLSIGIVNGSEDYIQDRSGLIEGDRVDLVHIQIGNKADVLSENEMSTISSTMEYDADALDGEKTLDSMKSWFGRDNSQSYNSYEILKDFALGELFNEEGNNIFKKQGDDLYILGKDGEYHRLKDTKLETINSDNVKKSFFSQGTDDSQLIKYISENPSAISGKETLIAQSLLENLKEAKMNKSSNYEMERAKARTILEALDKSDGNKDNIIGGKEIDYNKIAYDTYLELEDIKAMIQQLAASNTSMHLASQAAIVNNNGNNKGPVDTFGSTGANTPK